MGCVWIMEYFFHTILQWIWWQVRFYVMSWFLFLYTLKKCILSSFINYCSSNKKDNDDTNGEKHNDDGNNNDNDNDNNERDEDDKEADI